MRSCTAGDTASQTPVAWLLRLRRLEPRRFRASTGSADVLLDSFGWSGCHSMLEVFARALPVATLAGKTMRSRHAGAMLRQIGLDRSVCETDAEFVEAAVTLGLKAEAREALVKRRHRLNGKTAFSAMALHLLGACANPLMSA